MAFSNVHEHAMSFLVELKNCFEKKEGALEDYVQIMKDFKERKIETDCLIEKITNLFDGNKNLILGFNNFLPKNYEIPLPDEHDDTAITFVKKVKSAFMNDQQGFSDFLEILHMYRLDKKSIIEVYQEVAALFRGHRDLLVEFKKFLPDTTVKRSCSPPPLDIIHARKKRKTEVKSKEIRVCSKEPSFFDKVRAIFGDSDTCQQLMKYVEIYKKEIITSKELCELAGDLVGEYPDLIKGLDEFLKISIKTKKSKNMCSNKFMEESDGKLDFYNFEEITPCYRLLLPADCTDTTTVHEILNDQFKCVPHESYGVPVFRYRNKYEENLFKCEDEIFKMDLEEHRLDATIKSAEELVRKMEIDNTLGVNSALCLEDNFTALNLKCIKEAYSSRGDEQLERLRQNSRIVLPIILNKLKREQSEMLQIRADSNKHFARVMAANHRNLLRSSSTRKA